MSIFNEAENVKDLLLYSKFDLEPKHYAKAYPSNGVKERLLKGRRIRAPRDHHKDVRILYTGEGIP